MRRWNPDQIWHRRQKAGLSQQKLAEAIDVRPQTLSLWELGRRVPQATFVARLADFFHASTDDFFEEEWKDDDD